MLSIPSTSFVDAFRLRVGDVRGLQTVTPGEATGKTFNPISYLPLRSRAEFFRGVSKSACDGRVGRVVAREHLRGQSSFPRSTTDQRTITKLPFPQIARRHSVHGCTIDYPHARIPQNLISTGSGRSGSHFARTGLVNVHRLFTIKRTSSVKSTSRIGFGLLQMIRHASLADSTVEESAWEILSRPEQWSCAALRRDWSELVKASDNLNVMYQSPDWFDHLQAVGEVERLALAVYRDGSGRAIALAPLRIARYPFEFHVHGNSLGRIPILKLFFLGGGPVGPHEPSLLDGLLLAAMRAFPEAHGLGFPAVEAGTPLWHYVDKSPFIREHLLPYVIDGLQDYHVLPLPPSFTEYLARYDGKKRYNLKRQVRILREHGGGELELRRIDHVEHLPFYLDALSKLGSIGSSLKPSSSVPFPAGGILSVLQSVAERGILRNYVLSCGGSVVGCIRACQYRNVLAVSEIPLDPAYTRFSPGVVMLYLAIEDLTTHRPVRFINFGFGEPDRKHHPSNMILSYASIVLMRKTVANRFRLACHKTFRSSVMWIKRQQFFRHAPASRSRPAARTGSRRGQRPGASSVLAGTVSRW